ncbi:MAG: D-aminoacyl-tRNA deacylase [Bacteroidia bacterium]
MRVVIQRVSRASIHINKELHSSIGKGLLVLLGIEAEDELSDVEYLCKKIAGLRIFSDDEGKMNLSLKDIQGDCLLVSQFTLFANTSKGNRPSFIQAARPEIAVPLYEACIQNLNEHLDRKIQTGEFGADMQIELINDGPVTLLIDSKAKN